MELATSQKEIGGKQWQILLLPPTRGLELGRRLLALLGPVVGKAVGAVAGAQGGAKGAAAPAGSMLDADIDPGLLGDTVSALAAALASPDAPALIKELVTTGVHCDGKEVNGATFDLLFQGEYQTLMLVTAWIIEANFKIPFGSLAAVARRQFDRQTADPSPPAPEKS